MVRSLDEYIDKKLKSTKQDISEFDEDRLKIEKSKLEDNYLMELRNEVEAENKQYYV